MLATLLIAFFVSISHRSCNTVGAGDDGTVPRSIYDELGAPTFRTPKNILLQLWWLLSRFMARTDHLLWEWNNRSVYFKEPYLRYVEPYLHKFNVISLGKSIDDKAKSKHMTFLRTWDRLKFELNSHTDIYEPTFNSMQSIISTHAIDVVLADSICVPSIDAAHAAKTSFIITMMTNWAADAFAPYNNKDLRLPGDGTTEDMSLGYRFYVKLILSFCLQICSNRRNSSTTSTTNI
ncbi:hypothetical protein BDB00DRAFT_876979 [Zychaea mexicana]|uniref:uncharacterized protein n=1 Tax=Zychaea mexicana TaxID=64656 RepID=UPI0022FF23A9|nr:uncharacterized protein BDB00DRAFT_876979 [Zychaea mexicana]KAI9488914.1 hypothetical protein BDB00DRAFT_876979 [Zychaea mexicana]